MKRILLTIAAATALGACASGSGEPQVRGIAQYADDPRLGEQTDRICFTSNIDGFSRNDRNSVLLQDGNRQYMVEVVGTCFDLENALSIALDDVTGCLTPGDSIIVADTMGESFGPNRCMVRKIYTWDSKAEPADAEASPGQAAEENPA